MRRLSRLVVLILVLTAPVAAFAGGPDEDPNGLAAPAPVEWTDTVMRFFVAWLGI